MDHLFSLCYVKVEMVCFAPLSGLVNGAKVWCLAIMFNEASHDCVISVFDDTVVSIR